ncbi:MAG: hypothetical protein ACXACE_04280 [Candidatus Thorarchaeota archaeon]|jgi:hypothetical protein
MSTVGNMTYAFVVFYRFMSMTPEEAGKARDFWAEFSTKEWPTELKIVGDYRFAWGTEWNGFIFLETENPQLFFDFWPRFRDKTRWYIENTRTIIGQKRDSSSWMR